MGNGIKDHKEVRVKLLTKTILEIKELSKLQGRTKTQIVINAITIAYTLYRLISKHGVNVFVEHPDGYREKLILP